MLFCIPKILKNESNSQLTYSVFAKDYRCFVSQRYWKMKAIHNSWWCEWIFWWVVLYPKDTEKWKQFTTIIEELICLAALFCIPKILKNESNSQPIAMILATLLCCFVSQRYWKMKAMPAKVHWKLLFCIPKILKNESNSQPLLLFPILKTRCFVSQRYWKMKAIHNLESNFKAFNVVVLYPKDTEKWKQFTTL